MRDHWVFGYASLMWYPGIKYEEASLALLIGGHRSLCIKSKNYRGTKTKPGIVFGLDAGGVCTGMAYRIRAKDYPEARSYLRRREMRSFVYREATRHLKLLDGSHREVRAMTYVVNRDHPHYLGKIPYERQAHIVRTSRGRNGRNLHYFLNTVHHLRDLNIHDPHLERLCAFLGESRRKSWDDSHENLVF